MQPTPPYLKAAAYRQHLLPDGIRSEQYIDASQKECFKNLKCSEDLMRRVGVIPYYFDPGGHMHIRLAAPEATKEEDIILNKKLPFQIARGCLDAFLPNGGSFSLRTEEEFQNALANHLRIEEPIETAFHEAKEELGVNLPRRLKKCIDCGVLKYTGKTGEYGIQLYAIEVDKPEKVSDKPDHSRAAQWFSPWEFENAIENNEFKKSYEAITTAVIKAIREVHQELQRGVVR